MQRLRGQDRKSQNMSAFFRLVAGCRFWVWMKSGNFKGSRMKKTGCCCLQVVVALFGVKLDGESRGSRAESAEPFSPPTWKNGQRLPSAYPHWDRNLALV